MKLWKKVVIFLAVVVALAVLIGVSIARSQAGRVTVQTASATRQDVIALVTASGEIKPKSYADVAANSIGQVRALLVKEGDHVRKGQLLAVIDNIQQGADVNSYTAALHTAQASYQSQQAALATAVADKQNNDAQLAQAEQDWRRAERLYENQLLDKADYQTKETAYASAQAEDRLSAAKVTQSRADIASALAAVNQAKANLVRVRDVYAKTLLTSPLDGLVTYLPVHVGDTVVMGIQNQPGSLVMRVADMGVVTAELKVDETDIVNVHLGQPATLTIDAYGDRKFPAVVTEVGDTALLRSTGQVETDNSTAATDEAKDFKVVVTLQAPPSDMKPGLSCTAQITTAVAHNAISVPLQAIIERDKAELDAPPPGTTEAAAPTAPAAAPQPEQGIFVLRNEKAMFVAVQTGVTGVDRVQVLNGVEAGDQVVVGPYRALRTMRNLSRVKVDNSTQNLSAQTAG